MILAGLAAALICGALLLRQLGGTRSKAKQTLPAEVSREANARVLREMGELHATGGALFEHSQEADEPCGESCTKDHVHTHTLTLGSKDGSDFIRAPQPPTQSPLYRMVAEDLQGMQRSMSEFAGKVLLITNVASQCGYTESNYHGLQAMYEKYQARGFEVLAFPCNQFGLQEPDDTQGIADVVRTKYGVTFPVFKKVEVNGEHAHAIMKFVVQQLYGADSSTSFASWNFYKYLIDRRGFPVKQYGSSFDATVLEADIEAQLLKPAAGQAHQDGVLHTALQ